MGSTFSQDKILLDCSYHQLPFTKRTKPACSAWGYTKAKIMTIILKDQLLILVGVITDATKGGIFGGIIMLM